MSTDRLVFWGMLVAVIGVWIAAGFGYLGTGFAPIIIAVVVTLDLLFVVALDARRRPGSRPMIDV